MSIVLPVSLGKSEWRDMLQYLALLHARSVHPPIRPFPHPWEEIGPGYCYGPAFGHWDLIHAVLDVLPFDKEHARNQILNNLAAQHEDGFLPGAIWIDGKTTRWNLESGHPPVWPIAAQEYVDRYDADILSCCYEAIVRQIRWFETNRKADDYGFFYTDILNHSWESGVDEGIRFLEIKTGKYACVDATSHVYLMYVHAGRWGKELGEECAEFEDKADEVATYIRGELFVEDTDFFHDIWSAREAGLRCGSFEGMWPVVVGAATPEQAEAVIEKNLMNPDRFLSTHPVSTVSLDDPRFELRMWRGPAWNSMTYWAAQGCVRYGAFSQAAKLLEMALDDSAKQYNRTGTIWEFYHPTGRNPEELVRKPHTEFNAPCRDYLGHNPLLAMALLYDEAIIKSDSMS